MNREEAVLAVLAAADGRSLSPVQLQKAVFLVDKNLPDTILNERFSFAPYDYGPFDAMVYRAGEALASRGLATVGIAPNGRWKSYAASAAGVTEGAALLAAQPEVVSKYIVDVVNWVSSLSFASLVKSIYSAYPEMKANSIFTG